MRSDCADWITAIEIQFLGRIGSLDYGLYVGNILSQTVQANQYLDSSMIN